MSWDASRHISLFDVPEPVEVTVRFNYNFFVPDEKTNSTGMPAYQGEVTAATQSRFDSLNVQSRLPRYVEIEFTSVIAGFDQIGDLAGQNVLSAHSNRVQDEGKITSIKDALVSYQDSNIKERISAKAGILLGLLGTEDLDASEIELIANQNYGINLGALEAVLKSEAAATPKFVNDVGEHVRMPIFAAAEGLSLDMLADRRLLSTFFGGNYGVYGDTKTQLQIMGAEDGLKFLPLGLTEDGNTDYDEPTVEVFDELVWDVASNVVESQTCGYVIERNEVLKNGSLGETVSYYLDAPPPTLLSTDDVGGLPSSNRFLDTQIVYGKTYRYGVRTVALCRTVFKQVDNAPGFKRAMFLLSSKARVAPTVETVETVPPIPPDGVFYRFNYDTARGLFIQWQIPVGKQRDVKYFQVFRRSNIHEAFTCIAEIDFDDSDIRSSKMERVNPDRVIRAAGAQRTFMDPDFSRSSDYIYAIAAIDAHGLSSGYSAQTRISFDKTRNELKLRNVSAVGAPKQYPNFFVDPELDENTFTNSLTQDSMQSSKKHSMRIYFEPDALRYSSTTGAAQPETSSLVSLEDSASYKLLLLNVDRQKSVTIELKVEDRRSPSS